MSRTSRRRLGARWNARTAAAVLLVTACLTSGVPLAVPASADEPAQRYLDEVFPTVRVTKDIKYSRQLNVNGWEDLYLDLYEPVGDTSRDRPAIIWVHGGGFAAGNKQGGNEVEMSTELARRGFVVVSIGYRLDPGNGWGSFDDITEALADDRFFNSVLRGTNDVGFAARFLRQNAAAYNLHPEAIFAAGYSAGAVASLTKAYLPVHSQTIDTRLAAVGSLAGMTFPFYAEVGEPPTIMFHGTKDASVPYAGAKDFCDTAGTRITCELMSFPGQGHGITSDWEVIREGMATFFYDQVLAGLGFTTEVNPLGGASTFHPLEPFRLVDTRTGLGAPAAALGAGETLVIDPTGTGGVPGTGVTGVVANVTVTGATADSHLTVWPDGEPMPLASSLNWPAGATRANLVTVKTGADGDLALTNNAGEVDVLVDVVGWLGPDPAGDRLHTLPPARIVDTRSGLGAPAVRLGPAGTLTIDPTGSAGVPETRVTGVIANVTVTGGSAASHLTVWPTGGPAPLVSSLNWSAGQTVPNQVVTSVGTDGTFQVRNNSGNVDVIVDVVAWLGPEVLDGRGCTLVSPTRVLDTRAGIGGPVAPIAAGTPRDLTVSGTAGIPMAGVGATFANTTVTGGTLASHLTVWPAGGPIPTVSNLNWLSGETVPNHTVATLGTGGAVSIANQAGTADVVSDVTAWC